MIIRSHGNYFNTDTAVLLCQWDEGRANDPDFLATLSLYRTRTNKFFVHGKGGARTIYAFRKNGEWRPGEKIHQVTAVEALELSTKHGNAAAIEEVRAHSALGELPRGKEEKKKEPVGYSCRLSREAYDLLQKASKARATSKKAVIEDLILNHLSPTKSS